MKSNLLYENTLFYSEQAIRKVKQREQFSLGREFSQTNAKMHLVAPTPIADQYLVAALLMEDWSQLHAKASPRQIDWWSNCGIDSIARSNGSVQGA